MPDTREALYRALPSMNAVLEAMNAPVAGGQTQIRASLPRTVLKEHVQAFLDRLRGAIDSGSLHEAEELGMAAIVPQLLKYVDQASRPHLRPVLNATGVVIHTNLGRSRLAEEAARAVHETALAYTNLEFDLDTGERGSRYCHVEGLICRLTGAEAALVVNNNAAAVLLTLDTLCKGREVIVSRGELVEIGGSFRIPEVMEKSGCVLREIGATNRTHLKDYAGAINEQTSALLKVHTSNYRITGFTSAVPREELAELAGRNELPLIEDLGSGTLFDFTTLGLPALSSEPSAARILGAGVDMVTFSGDKVLGGPQAGIIAGKKRWIEQIKKNPLNRALRIDKLTLAALEATLQLCRDPAKAMAAIPTLRMLCEDENSLRSRAKTLAQLLNNRIPELSVSLRAGVSRTGGGAFPEQDLPTCLVCVHQDGLSPDRLKANLLQSDPPVVARIENGSVCLDPRTLDDDEFGPLAEALEQAINPL